MARCPELLGEDWLLPPPPLCVVATDEEFNPGTSRFEKMQDRADVMTARSADLRACGAQRGAASKPDSYVCVRPTGPSEAR